MAEFGGLTGLCPKRKPAFCLIRWKAARSASRLISASARTEDFSAWTTESFSPPPETVAARRKHPPAPGRTGQSVAELPADFAVGADVGFQPDGFPRRVDGGEHGRENFLAGAQPLQLRRGGGHFTVRWAGPRRRPSSSSFRPASLTARWRIS